jgi:hypothetical protein
MERPWPEIVSFVINRYVYGRQSFSVQLFDVIHTGIFVFQWIDEFDYILL